MKSSCPEYDGSNYPSDLWLDMFEAWKPASFQDAALFIAEDAPAIFESLGYATVAQSTDREGAFCLFIATGGWSGCESVIGAMRNKWELNYYWQMEARGGAYWYKVDAKMLAPGTMTAHMGTGGEQ